MSAQKSKPVGVLGAVAGLVGLSAIAGVLVTAMITPAIAVTGIAANSTAGIFEDLPDYITITGQSERNTIWATQGGQPVVLAQVFDEDREEVAWDQVSQFAKDAAVASEDERFYEHGGVDVAGIARAAVNNATSEETQGASTIDQQLVKNLLINEAIAAYPPDSAEREQALIDAQGATLDRKLREAKLAIGLEKRYTKDEILLAYLNIVNFGGNTYGIQAASQKYYSTTAANLTAAQAASLMAIIQLPGQRRPDDSANWERNQTRRDAILGNMLELGNIDQPTYDAAVATPVNETTLLISNPQNGCLYAIGAKNFCDYVVRNIKNLTSLGATEDERLANWKRGGYNIFTTIDLDQNAVAEQTLAARAPATETRFQLGAAASTVQVGTGRIIVMAQNKTFDNTDAAASDSTKTALNFNTDSGYGGSTGFQVGSTYKLFTLVNWLQNGHGLREVVNGSPANYVIKGSCATNPSAPFKNDGNSNPGRISVLQATSASVNAAFGYMASRLDICSIADTAASMGVHRADGAPLETYASSVLGTDTIAPLSIANAYATVSSGGILCNPIAVDRVVAPDGTEMPGQSADCHQAIAPDVAAAAANALQGVMSGGTGSAANPRDGTPLIGKTGTADAVSTFIATASTKVASAVWVGNIVGQQSLRQISVNGTNGGQLRFGIMRAIQTSLDDSAAGTGAGVFPPVSAALLRGQTLPVPNVTGQTPEAARRAITGAGLEYRLGATIASDVPVGMVAGTQPGAGSPVSRGSEVEVQISDGSLATTMPNVAQLRLPEAYAALSSAGFDTSRVTVNYVPSSPQDTCLVTASDPGGGTAVSKTAPVTLSVNGGDANNLPSCG